MNKDKTTLLKTDNNKASIVMMIIECGRQLDMLNASDRGRSIELTKGNYDQLCKELEVKSCNWVDRFIVIVKGSEHD